MGKQDRVLKHNSIFFGITLVKVETRDTVNFELFCNFITRNTREYSFSINTHTL